MPHTGPLTAPPPSSQALLASVLNASLDGIMAFASVRSEGGQIEDFEWLVVNTRAATMVGRAAASLVGRRLLQEMPGNLDEGLFDSYVAVVEQRQPFVRELRYSHEGLDRWFLLTAVPLADGFAVTFRDVTQQKEAEELRVALAAGQMGTWELDPQRALVSGSATLPLLFGLPASSDPRPLRHYLQRLHPEDRAGTVAAIQQAARRGDEFGVEFRVGLPGGEWRWLSTRGRPLHDEAGQLRRLLGALSDVTESRAAQEALRRSEERYRALVEASGQTLWGQGADGTTLADGAAWWGELTGQSPDEARGEGWLAVVHPEDRQRARSAWATAFQRHHPLDVDYRVQARTGGYRALAVRGFPLFEPDGTLREWVGTMRDITQQRQAEAARRDSEALAQRRLAEILSIYSVLPVGLAFLSPELRFIKINPALAALSGQPPERWIGQRAETLLPPALAAPTLACAPQVLATGEAVENLEIEGQSHALPSQTRTWLVSYLPVQSEAGKMLGVNMLLIDMSERKATEQQLRAAKEAAEAANHAKSVFLANMSHEIRTPLTSMIGFASLLVKRLEPGKLRSHAQRIEQGGRRLSQTLNAVLTLAKLEAGNLELLPEPLRVADEVEQVVALFQAQAQAKGLALRFDLEPAARDSHVLLDRGALNSVLQNLIANALKFTDSGQVRVTLLPEGELLAVAVEDTGRGIAADFLPHIFDSFRQESAGLNRTHEGSGLGLTIAKQLTELMGGALMVTSTVGRGSRFTVRFPRIPLPQSQPTATPSTQEGEPTLGHLLVVEDTVDVQEVIRELLAGRYRVTVAASADEALRVIQGDERFDGVLMDINLGSGPDGTQALSVLRTLREYRTLPVAAVTAYALPGDRERFLSLGFDDYLRKPFTADELLALLERLTRRDGAP